MLEQKIDLLIAAIDKNTAAITGGKPAASVPAATAPAAGKPGPGRPPAAGKAPKVTADMIGEKATALKESAGMPAVRALFKENGSEDGKMASVPKENYPALFAALEAALAGDEPEATEDEDSL